MTAILVVSVLALTSGIASATTHVVNQTAPACTAPDPDVPANYYATIQAAINAGSGGDTIIVCPETTAYQETVDVTKSDIVIKAFNETKPGASTSDAKLDEILDAIKNKGAKWTAGTTSVS